MSTLRTIRIATITHAQAIRLPGEALNSIQINGVDRDGHSVRIILEPGVVKQMADERKRGKVAA
jgi:hypothetical protein